MKKVEAYAAVRGQKKAGGESKPKPKNPDTEESLSGRAIGIAQVVLPYVQDMTPDEWVQAQCLETLRHLVSTKLRVVLDLGAELFQLTMHLLRRESDQVHVEALFGPNAQSMHRREHISAPASSCT